MLILIQDLYDEHNGNRSYAKDVCIMFTDGKSNVDEHLTLEYGEKLKDNGM